MRQNRMEQIKHTQKASNLNAFFSIFLLLIFLFLFGKSVKSQVVDTYVDSAGIAGYNGDGIRARAARINITYGNVPGTVAVDNNGDVYIADYANHRIRRVNKTTNIITTVVGTGVAGFSGDGGLATNAQLNYPVCIAFDLYNNMYISDASNVRIRKVDAITKIITTVAGNGTFGGLGDGGLATSSQFRSLSYLTLDGSGNIYVIDLYRIRKIDAGTNIISAFAGQATSGFSNDIPAFATSTYFGGVIGGILSNNVGIVYVTDGHRVRKIQGGIISTIVGHFWDNGQLFGGDNGLATDAYFTNIGGLSWGIYGEMYLCDVNNNVIRKYNPSTGIITTAVGDISSPGYPFLNGGFNGDLHYPTATKLHYPSSVAVNAAGEMFILDVGNNRIRKVYYPCTPVAVNSNVTVCSSALPYHWAGLSLTSSGNYTIHKTMSNGCDSAATLRLTVLGIMPAITGPNNVCVGSSVQLSDSFVGGNWTSVNGRATVNNLGLVTGTSAGVATVKYSFVNELGCNATATYFVTVNSIPSVPSIQYAPGLVNPQSGAGGGNNYCNNRTFGLIGIPGRGLWSSSNTSILTVNSITGIVNTVSNGSGSLTYTYTTSAGCSNSRTIVGNVVSCLGSRAANFFGSQSTPLAQLYPNPAKNLLSIEINGEGQNNQIVITDLLGKIVLKQTLSIGKNAIQIDKLNKGIYLVAVISNNEVFTQKLLIE